MAAILSPNRVQIGSAGHFWSTYQAVADEAHTLEDVVSPDYWAHVASSRSLRINDIFEVRSETGAWAADLIVIDAGHRSVKMALKWSDLAESPRVPDEGLKFVSVAFKGAVKKHCIIRRADNEIIKEGIALKADALRDAVEYEKRMTV